MELKEKPEKEVHVFEMALASGALPVSDSLLAELASGTGVLPAEIGWPVLEADYLAHLVHHVERNGPKVQRLADIIYFVKRLVVEDSDLIPNGQHLYDRFAGSMGHYVALTSRGCGDWDLSKWQQALSKWQAVFQAVVHVIAAPLDQNWRPNLVDPNSVALAKELPYRACRDLILHPALEAVAKAIEADENKDHLTTLAQQLDAFVQRCICEPIENTTIRTSMTSDVLHRLASIVLACFSDARLDGLQMQLAQMEDDLLPPPVHVHSSAFPEDVEYARSTAAFSMPVPEHRFERKHEPEVPRHGDWSTARTAVSSLSFASDDDSDDEDLMAAYELSRADMAVAKSNGVPSFGTASLGYAAASLSSADFGPRPGRLDQDQSHPAMHQNRAGWESALWSAATERGECRPLDDTPFAGKQSVKSSFGTPVAATVAQEGKEHKTLGPPADGLVAFGTDSAPLLHQILPKRPVDLISALFKEDTSTATPSRRSSVSSIPPLVEDDGLPYAVQPAVCSQNAYAKRLDRVLHKVRQLEQFKVELEQLAVKARRRMASIITL